MLYQDRRDGSRGLVISNNLLKGTTPWRAFSWFRLFDIFVALRKVKPDVVHLHSSRAGFYFRVFFRHSKVFFSPHCYSFQKTNIPFVLRKTLFVTEKILLRKTFRLVAHWPIEVKLAGEMGANEKLIYYPSLKTRLQKLNQPKVSRHENHKVISVGRVSAQKDPSLIASLAVSLEAFPDIQLVWVGAGDDKFTQELTKRGVFVTGWKNADEIASWYEEACITIIASKWESGPFTLFESLNHGTPVLARKSDAIDTYTIDTFKNLEELREKLLFFIHDCGNPSILQDQIAHITAAQKKYHPLQKLYDQ